LRVRTYGQTQIAFLEATAVLLILSPFLGLRFIIQEIPYDNLRKEIIPSSDGDDGFMSNLQTKVVHTSASSAGWHNHIYVSQFLLALLAQPLNLIGMVLLSCLFSAGRPSMSVLQRILSNDAFERPANAALFVYLVHEPLMYLYYASQEHQKAFSAWGDIALHSIGWTVISFGIGMAIVKLFGQV